MPTCSAESENRDKISTDIDERNNLPILNKLFLSWWTKNKKFCLFRYQGNIAPLTVLECEDEQVLKAEDVIGNQDTVICLSDTGVCLSDTEVFI